MHIFIDGRLYDTNLYPVVMVFNNDKERLGHAENLKSNFKPKKGKRFYAVGRSQPDIAGKIEKVRGLMKHRKTQIVEDLPFTDQQRAESAFNHHIQSQKYPKLYLVALDVNHHRIDLTPPMEGLIVRKYETNKF